MPSITKVAARRWENTANENRVEKIARAAFKHAEMNTVRALCFLARVDIEMTSEKRKGGAGRGRKKNRAFPRWGSDRRGVVFRLDPRGGHAEMRRADL